MLCKTVAFLFVFFAYGYGQMLTVTSNSVSLTNNDVLPVVEGSNLVFQCATADDGAVIILNSAVTPDQTSGNATHREYTVENVQRDITGTEFDCGDGNENLVFTIDVQYPPSISSLTNGTGPEQGSATVYFTIDANPAVVEDDIKVTPSMPDSVSISGSNVTLTYTDLQRSDAGSYQLTVNNSVNSTTATFTIDVFFGPDFTNNGGGITVTVGEALRIDCSVSESNPSNVIVNISGTNLAETPLDTNDRIFTVINSVNRAFNGNMYTCTASNGETTNSITYSVTVMEPTATTTRPMPSTSSRSGDMSTSASMTPSSSPDSSGATVVPVIGSVVIAVILAIIINVFNC